MSPISGVLILVFSQRILSDLCVSVVNIRLKTLTAETKRSQRRRENFKSGPPLIWNGTSVAPHIADVADEAMLKSAKVNTRFAPQSKRIQP
jgi:hypothetical protein